MPAKEKHDSSAKDACPAFRPAWPALLLAASLWTAPAPASPGGELDFGFGDHGRILLRESRFGEVAGIEAFVDPVSGQLLTVGSSYYSNMLLRFHADGSLDQDFGDRGIVRLDLGDDSLNILDVEQLSDGRLLIVGALNVYGDPDNVIHGSGLLARMHADGTPDTSFGDGGRATFQLGGVYEALSRIMLQADGRIVVYGSTNRTGSVERVLARYTQDGVLDTRFASGSTPGVAIVKPAGIDAIVDDVVQQRDTSFLACGYTTPASGAASPNEIVVFRVGANGTRDAAFGNDGMVSIAGWPEPVQVAECLELADGHLVLAGSSGRAERQRGAAFRLAPDGRLDTAFGQDGVIVLDTASPSAAATMLVMSDGSLAIAGSQWPSSDEESWWVDMLVSRIDPTSGAIDRTFGNRGTTAIDFGTRGYPGSAVASSLRQQPDGKLVIVGSQVDRYDWYYAFNVALARVDPYGSGSNGWAGLVTTHATASRGNDTVSLLLRRTGGSTGELSVDYRTIDDTAIAGEHYVAGSGTVTWSDGDLGDKAISVDILNRPASFQHFAVELFDSSGGLAGDRAIVSISPAATAPPPPPPAPPASGGSGNGSSGGGGAIGIEWSLLPALSVFGLRRRRLASAGDGYDAPRPDFL